MNSERLYKDCFYFIILLYIFFRRGEAVMHMNGVRKKNGEFCI